MKAIDYGFLISRVMHFYSLKLPEVLKLPIVQFYMLHKNVDRISAERDLRTANLAVHTQTGDGIKELWADLRKTMGQTVVYETAPAPRKEETLDREGLHSLKALARM